MKVRAVMTLRLAAVALILTVCSATLIAAERDELGRTEKLRVLVDKVIHYATDDEGVVREVAAAGFNVVTPREGGGNLAGVQRVAELAAKYGIYHMPWMRGTLTANEDVPEQEKLVWAGGHVSNLYSPNSDGLWDWMSELIVGYANISAQQPALIGVFLDYENYDRPAVNNAYYLSYDSKIMGEFAAAQGLELPELAPEERFPWLKDHGLHEEFNEFQVAHWRQRCRTLRKAVDAINPKFRFCVYPAPGTKFIREAICAEWGTAQAPLILADAVTYGRGGWGLSHRSALLSNRGALLNRRAQVQQDSIPFMYMGGLDPVCAGADPEFLGRSAVMSAEATDGYWVFYEGPAYDGDHPAYFNWFTRANQAITEGNYDFWREPRETPDIDSATAELKRRADELQVQAIFAQPGRGEGNNTRLRGQHLILVDVRDDGSLQATLTNPGLGQYMSAAEWTALSPQGHQVGQGKTPAGQSSTIELTGLAPAIYNVVISAGHNHWSFSASKHAWAVLTPLHIFVSVGRLYFWVPEGTQKFSITITSPAPRETATLRILDPQGNKMAQVTTVGAPEGKATAEVQVPEALQSNIWSITLTAGEVGVLEDAWISFGDNLPPYVSPSPTRMLIPAGEPTRSQLAQ